VGEVIVLVSVAVLVAIVLVGESRAGRSRVIAVVDVDGREDAVRARLYGQRTETVTRLSTSSEPRTRGQPRGTPTSNEQSSYEEGSAF
jgi:hypothetical protein